MGLQADMGIVASCLRRREEDERGVEARRLVGDGDQLATDTLSLDGDIDREIGQIGTERTVGERARHADEPSVIRARRGDDIGLCDHACHQLEIRHRPTLGQRGALQHVDERLDGQMRLEGVHIRHASSVAVPGTRSRLVGHGPRRGAPSGQASASSRPVSPSSISGANSASARSQHTRRSSSHQSSPGSQKP